MRSIQLPGPQRTSTASTDRASPDLPSFSIHYLLGQSIGDPAAARSGRWAKVTTCARPALPLFHDQHCIFDIAAGMQWCNAPHFVSNNNQRKNPTHRLLTAVCLSPPPKPRIASLHIDWDAESLMAHNCVRCETPPPSPRVAACVRIRCHPSAVGLPEGQRRRPTSSEPINIRHSATQSCSQAGNCTFTEEEKGCVLWFVWLPDVPNRCCPASSRPRIVVVISPSFPCQLHASHPFCEKSSMIAAILLLLSYSSLASPPCLLRTLISSRGYMRNTACTTSLATHRRKMKLNGTWAPNVCTPTSQIRLDKDLKAQ
ncbi:hypothetical protein B0T25DRAFT_556859 [Lasiosphaeria hispida]|uniref:Uncharacterized protein n=1 Tax=Lasiosphaeria hispida TaxID=260671 RepID=A0AAJ0H9T8_9PEZI|nr:hypothetical protein B0T25DRAFT_556859 [Lasiosphaeria hispida]